MRYDEIDLQIEDIMWFGVDNFGHVFACTSAGKANVPKFVCKSKEENEELLDFFEKQLKKTTKETLYCEYEDNCLVNDGIDLARKGLFVFDAVEDARDPHFSEYVKIVSPVEPVNITQLPERIKSLLESRRVSGDVASLTYLRVEHAY